MECETLKEFFEKHKEKIITLLLCGVLFIIVLSVLALISGAIMKVFGFEYRSIGSIILFFIIATIISYPLGLIAVGLVFNAGGVKDVLLELFNKIIGA